MAGGPFDGKITVVAEVPGDKFATVIKQLQEGINDGEGKWNFGLAYSLVLQGKNVAILGMGSHAVGDGGVEVEMQERIGASVK